MKTSLHCLLLATVPLLVNCTVQTKFVSNFAALDSTSLVLQSGFSPRTEKPIVSKSCFSKVGLPFQWELKTDQALKKALSSRPPAIGLIHAEFTTEFYVTGIFNRICVIIKGQPVYTEPV